MIKAIFFDMDGTLVAQPQGVIPKSAVQALKDLREKGILLFAATGRHRLEMETKDFYEEVHFDGFASLNGQICYTAEKVLLRRCMEKEDIKAFVDYLGKNPIPCEFEEEDRLYTNFHTEGFTQAMSALNLPLPDVGDMEGITQRDIFQIVTYCDEDIAENFVRTMPASKFLRWNPSFVDIAPKVGGKTEGMEVFLKEFGISWEETMAFGDGQNDIEMVKAVHIGIAMGNADPKLKAAADYVTADADKDGIALALAHFGLL